MILPYFRVVLLENMVGPEEVDQYLEEEVAEECSKFGQILCIRIHLKGGGESATATDTGSGERSTNEASTGQSVRIFVHFDSHAAAVNAIHALNGRFFAGREIAARLYPDEDFQMRNLDL